MADGKAAAWQISKKGLLPVIMQKQTLDIPRPREGEVLVEVHASAVNPVDWKLAGSLPGFMQALPRTVASDLSGVILAHGPGLSPEDASRLKVGTRVLGINDAVDVGRGVRPGTMATHAIVAAKQVAELPESYSFAEGAAFPLTGLTAYAMLAHAKQGEKVLVLGGTTSVGLLLLQMLKIKGVAKVVATASGDKKKVAKEKGADEVIDYRESNVIEELKRSHSKEGEQFDAILDCVGDGAVFKASPPYLKKNGIYYNVGASFLEPGASLLQNFGNMSNLISLFVPWWLGGTPRKSVMGGLNKDVLVPFAQEFIQTKKLHATIDTEFAFDDAKKAYERLMSNRALGKVVVNVRTS